MTRTLYKAGPANVHSFGFGTCWAESWHHAAWYTALRGFGGPIVYEAVVEIADNAVDDCTGDARAALTRWGFDGSDSEFYPDGSLHEDLIRLATSLAADRPYIRWVTFDVAEPPGFVTWVYLGLDDIHVDLAARQPIPDAPFGGAFTG